MENDACLTASRLLGITHENGGGESPHLHFMGRPAQAEAPLRDLPTAMPSLRIRCWRVERGTPSKAAAPVGPAMTPPARVKIS